MEAVAEFGGDEAGIVVMESADGDGVVEQDAVVGDVEDVGGELPVFADGVAGGDVEGGVDGEISAVVGAVAGQEAGSVQASPLVKPEP